MKRTIAILLVAILVLGVVACSAIPGLSQLAYFGAIPALAQGSGGTVTVEGGIMAVFYLIDSEEVIFYCQDVTIETSGTVISILNPGNTSVAFWDVTNLNATMIAYGLYKYKPLPDDLQEGGYYLDELALELPDYNDLPWSDHIGKLIDIDPSRAKPAQVRRFYMGNTYDFWCLVRQNVVDEYIAGDLAIGDWVTVSFIEEMPYTTEYHVAIVTGKVYESWD